MSKRGLSLQARVLVGMAGLALIAVAVAVAVTVTTERFLTDQLDARLASLTGPEVAGDRPWPEGSTTRLEPMPDVPTAEDMRPSEALRGYLDASGALTVRFEPTASDALSSAPAVSLDDLDAAGDTYLTVDALDGAEDAYRVLARPLSDGSYLITALPTEDVRAAVGRMVLIEVAGVGAVVAGMAIVAWWVVRLGVAPMRRMVDASGRIAAGESDVLLEGAAPGTESADLARSLNAMVGRLQGSVDATQRSQERLREFVADASHELRTPLTTVLGYAQLFRRGALSKKADQREAWQRTEAEAARMKRLVEDMLTLARLDAEPDLNRVTVSVTAILREVVRDAAAAYADLDATVEGESEACVTGDPDRLRQAIINVVTNAAQHGASTVRATVRRADSTVEVAVADDGPGMAPEVARRATERFVRADVSRARASGGAGLGLAITHAIVSAHGGEITIETELGRGTTVRISLPA